MPANDAPKVPPQQQSSSPRGNLRRSRPPCSTDRAAQAAGHRVTETTTRRLRLRSCMKYRAPGPLSIHQITCGVAEPQACIDQLLLYFEYFQCGISLDHKFALNRDHCAIYICCSNRTMFL